MPVTRELTQDELQELDKQGVDTSQLPKQLTLYTPEEHAQMQQQQEGQQAGQLGAVGRTLRGHAGSLVGGGLGGAGGFTLGQLGTTALAAAFPEVGLPLKAAQLLVPPVAGAISSYFGAKAGQAAQRAVVPQTTQQEWEQKAENSRQAFPMTSLATDVAGGMVAGGGAPSLKPPVYAAQGLLNMARSAGGSMATATQKQAIQNLVTGGALNTAINAGVQLATTGQVDMKELGGAAVGGLLFAKPSKLGTLLNPHWKPLSNDPKFSKQTEDQGVHITDEGGVEHVEDFIANKKRAEDNLKATQKAYSDTASQMGWNTMPSEETKYDEMYSAYGQQLKNQPEWLNKKSDNYVGDPGVRRSFYKRFAEAVDPGLGDDEKEVIKSRNANLKATPVDEMRQRLWEEDFKKNDPTGYTKWQAEAESRKQANVVEEAKKNEMLQISALTQTPSSLVKHILEELQAGKGAPTTTPTETTPTVTETTPSVVPTVEAAKMPETPGPGPGGHADATGKWIADQATMPFQAPKPGEQPTGSTKELYTEAAKHKTTIARVMEDDMLEHPEGGEARGMSVDPNVAGQRMVVLSKTATGDTGYHELLHGTIRDMLRSSDPADQQLAQRAIAAHAGEEQMVETGGKEYQDRVENRKGIFAKISDYYQDMAAVRRVKGGSKDPEDLRRAVVAVATMRSGESDPLLARQKALAVLPRELGEVGGRFRQEGETAAQEQPTDEKRFQGPQQELEEGYQKRLQKNPWTFTPTRTALESIAAIPHPDAKYLAGQFYKTHATRENLLGQWNNKVQEQLRQLTPEQQSQLDNVLYRERADRRFYKGQLSPELVPAYNVIREMYVAQGQHRLRINEPVMAEDRKPRPFQQDPFYHATTTEPKVADILREGLDTKAIDSLKADFIDQQLRHGRTQDDAEEAYKQRIEALKGDVTRESGANMLYYNGARRAEGVPEPDSWRRKDLSRNLQAYNHRLASDNAYYENIESVPKAAALLGYQKDAWHQPIPTEGINTMHGNTAVKAELDSLKGLDYGTKNERIIHNMEQIATVGLLGPPVELHKFVSSTAQSLGYFDTPIESAKALLQGGREAASLLLTGHSDAYTHALETGFHQIDARSASDFMNRSLSWGERLSGLAKIIRGCYTLNGLTDRVSKTMLQAIGEHLIPLKLQAAMEDSAAGNRARILLQHIDPDFQPGKQYSPNEQIKLASQFSNMMHGAKDARVLPHMLLHDNEISAFFKLASWNVAQTNNFMRHVVNPARSGDLQPLMMTALGATLGGAVVYQFRQKIMGKKSAVPSLDDAMNSSRGLEGNIPAVAYNLMASASFGGFAGILSLIAKAPMDLAFRNNAQGAIFPLDEVASNIARTATDVVEAATNDPTFWHNAGHVLTRATLDFFRNNNQLMRIGMNHLANNGIVVPIVASPELIERKQTSDKMDELRRFKAVEGLPLTPQGEAGANNPYFNLEQKSFHLQQDIGEAAHMLPGLVHDIVQRYGNAPDVMMAKLKALKSNTYSTMPSPEDYPMQFYKYVRFLKNSQGDEAASQYMIDYMRHKAINEAKGSMVP